MMVVSDRLASVLPVVGGRPVPYITRWVGESTADTVSLIDWSTGRLAYADEDMLDRDEFGVLWERERIRRNKTQPEWKHVNGHRQRRCMKRRLCQVCAVPLGDGPYHWIIPTPSLDVITDTPPVCEACADEVTDLCPALQRVGHHRLLVADFRLWGVKASVFKPFGEMVDTGVAIAYGTEWLRVALAKTQVVEFGEMEVMDG